jgi:hypothetical protein
MNIFLKKLFNKLSEEDIRAAKEKRFAKHMKYILQHQIAIVEIEE